MSYSGNMLQHYSKLTVGQLQCMTEWGCGIVGIKYLEITEKAVIEATCYRIVISWLLVQLQWRTEWGCVIVDIRCLKITETAVIEATCYSIILSWLSGNYDVWLSEVVWLWTWGVLRDILKFIVDLRSVKICDKSEILLSESSGIVFTNYLRQT